ncbi:hypothetical protein [Arcanobacterium hippocoleae]|uniref:Secreted protein n=1 Tax=Arcanobacterium hippocoleae TaxID=149017 RepID=A0ABU1T389_9ACTO|nr:hypothetical protein [Arcanobacterium hippocoleae]MDR6939847.1 hypothetical protein [Arcanobacterium hippocoleae]
MAALIASLSLRMRRFSFLALSPYFALTLRNARMQQSRLLHDLFVSPAFGSQKFHEFLSSLQILEKLKIKMKLPMFRIGKQ